MVSRRLELSLFVVAICLPTFPWCIFDPGFAFFAAPIWLGMAALAGGAIWVVLWLVRCPARVRAAILLSLSLGYSVHLGCGLHHTYTAPGRFERLLMDPIPQSVRFIATYGHLAMAGGEEVVVFTLDPDDFERIVRTCEFEELPPDKWKEDSFVPYCIQDAQGHGVEPGHVYWKGEMGDRRFLIANPEKTKAYLHRLRM
jgi:hypothetical protein